jgi:hypothetical protein
MPDGGDMWRQTQVGRGNPDAWFKDSANRCGSCGRTSAAEDFVWLWESARRAAIAPRGMFCLRCGPPEGEPRGADIAAAVRRSAASPA